MPSRNTVLSAVAYLALTFPLAYAWHLIAFRPFYDRIGYFGDEEPIVSLGFLTIAVQGLVLAYCYPFFQRGGSPIAEGLKFGGAFGIVLFTSQVVAAAAKRHAPATAEWFLMEGCYFVIQFSLIGIAFGLINGRSKTRL